MEQVSAEPAPPDPPGGSGGIGESGRITEVDALRALYGFPRGAAVSKEVDRLHPPYRALIEASPFAILATSGANGLDASPRGDPAGFVAVEDDRTLLLPDRRGNNRLDSLENILGDPRVALLFLIPGVGETLRVNGRAGIWTTPALLDRFVMDGKPPRSVLRIAIDTVYFQCSKAITRSHLWEAGTQVPRSSLPSAGQIMAAIDRASFDADSVDRMMADLLPKTLY